MINAKELRIGNLLLSDGVVVTIDARSIFDIWDESKEYNPIPITPEWLERLGFEAPHIKSALGLDVSNHQFIKKFVFNLGDGSDVPFLALFYVDGINKEYWMPFWTIKYIHQLQNLYFALTGQELTIKDI